MQLVSDFKGVRLQLYFQDMTEYRYGRKKESSLNIGWLEAGHPVHKGEVSKEFMEKLWKYLRYPVNIYRGFHTCNLCIHPEDGIPVVEANGEKRKVGYYEIRVWGNDGKVYAAPSLFYHYITHHNYKPPQEFIDAVMSAEEPDSKEYFQKVLEYSEGVDFWLVEDCTKI